MRQDFAQILKDAKIDIRVEYQKLYGMLLDRSIDVLGGKRISVYDELSDNFIGFYFRGTCLSIDEFDNMHGFHFEKEPVDFNIDKLILLCEYIENMLMGYQSTFSVSGYGYMAMTAQIPINIQFYMMQIGQVIEKIGYMRANKDGLSIFVEKSSAAIAVAEIVPKELSYKVISYNHYTMKGNLNAKKETLFAFANLLEPQREKMSSIDNKFSSDLFYAFNNFNIRHNNISPESPKYKKPIADLTQEQLEYWYDEIYQMALLAFLKLEHAERKKAFDEIKHKIENKI